MAVKISNITVSPQEVAVGQSITITITAVDVSWGVIKNEFTNWNELKTELSNWKSVLNHH
jgi:hypothetical protein